MTNLPNSEQTGNLDNLAVTRAEFRAEIGVFLEYVAQALGAVSGTYTTEEVNPFEVELQGAPTLEVGAEPVTADSTLRIPTTQWVKKSGQYVGTTAPVDPEEGMLWIDTTSTPFAIRCYNGSAWDVISGVTPGTRMLFQQTTAPIGWTKDVNNDNSALRVTAGTVSSGGTLDFSNVFSPGIPIAGTVGDTSLSEAQMPSHVHGASVIDPGHAHYYQNYARGGNSDRVDELNDNIGNLRQVTERNVTGIFVSILATGSGASHTHSFNSTDLNLGVKYVDCIIAEKN